MKPFQFKQFIIGLIFCLLSTICFSADTPTEQRKITSLGLYLTATEAYHMKESYLDKFLFIDVRTRAELAFVGMAQSVDFSIPYMLATDWDEWDDNKNNFKLFPNSNFLPYFEAIIQQHGLNKQSVIVLICRSGNRSASAANLLAKVGYTKVYSVVDGFEGDNSKDLNNSTINGWKNSGLPWSYDLDEEKMYMEF